MSPRTGRIVRCLSTKGYVVSIPGHASKFLLCIANRLLVGEKFRRLVWEKMDYNPSKNVEGIEPAFYRVDSLSFVLGQRDWNGKTRP